MFASGSNCLPRGGNLACAMTRVVGQVLMCEQRMCLINGGAERSEGVMSPHECVLTGCLQDTEPSETRHL